MSGENNFKDTVNSLFKGLDAFISAKTVVGEAIHVGDTIILPGPSEERSLNTAHRTYHILPLAGFSAFLF